MKIPDDILCDLANHFDSLSFRKLEGKTLSSQEEAALDAYKQVLDLMYPIPPLPKRLMDLAHNILETRQLEDFDA